MPNKQVRSSSSLLFFYHSLSLKLLSRKEYITLIILQKGIYITYTLYRSSLFSGITAVIRSIQKHLIREKFQNTPYYQLYSYETDLIPLYYSRLLQCRALRPCTGWPVFPWVSPSAPLASSATSSPSLCGQESA